MPAAVLVCGHVNWQRANTCTIVEAGAAAAACFCLWADLRRDHAARSKEHDAVPKCGGRLLELALFATPCAYRGTGVHCTSPCSNSSGEHYRYLQRGRH